MNAVIDTSVIGAWIMPDEDDPIDAAGHAFLRSTELRAPTHIDVEVGNLVRKAQRRGRVTAEQGGDALQAGIDILASVRRDGPPPLVAVLRLANAHDLTAYDAAYLELAIRHGAVLVTGDGPLARAAEKVGVRLISAI